MHKEATLAVLAAMLGIACAAYGASAYRSENPSHGSGGSRYGPGGVVGSSGTWGYWSFWSNCDKYCGGGYQTRTRQCNKPRYIILGNGNCHGDRSERRSCNTHYCAVNGGYSDWTAYSDCSAHCGGGFKYKTRVCNNPVPAYGGSPCSGSTRYTMSCNSHYCAVAGGWSEWGHYGDCSKSCGVGYKTKHRTCTNPAPQYHGADCYGHATYTVSCTGYHCPVDGGYTQWTQWSACSGYCGSGTKERTRTCTYPAPSYGGADCYGADKETQTCYHSNSCHGTWQQWGSWSDCDKYCGGGYQTRSRGCTRPHYAPAGYGDCIGDSSERRSCNTHYCAVNGGWSEWGHYGDCSKSCGVGYKTKHRTCTNPAPQYHGADCYGHATYTVSCTGYHCPVNGGWSEWGHYGDCSKSCGVGYKTKHRTCTHPAPQYHGADCYGHATYTVTCTGYHCPAVNGGYTHWSPWSNCSGHCGSGTKQRTRACTNPAPSYGGSNCYGANKLTASCYHSNSCGYGSGGY